MKYIGKIASGRDVSITETSPNGHLVITGVSGSGKSVRIADIEEHIVENGGTVIALDVNGTHEKNEKSKYFNYISAQKDGLNREILYMSLVNEGNETQINFIGYVQSSTDSKKVADLIDLNNKGKWISILAHLRIGQAVAVGELNIGGRRLSQLVITSSMYHESIIREGESQDER